ncbi:hypothetical protein SAMN04487928_12428 [Butyrivibrio proteoclasticus]|uniref:AAA domain-containing protein n=1 Tax=Butyrivibrio proteoclasticus TaxID=43305 RepID=A0A1I5WPQ5_9FIRM|nr:hypothetical protein [Butyrivibrio proteoclasticus]SFQ21690.1 hypothetical protein SAMN04487928_12428 [Butyrivibrio proteoclasticus]
MTRPLLTLCDLDETYCGRLYEYLKENLKLTFRIEAFTSVNILVDFARKNKTSLLVVSESALLELGAAGTEHFKNILILDEDSGGVREEESFYGGQNIAHTTKYQKAGKIVDTIVDFCAEKAEAFDGLTAEFNSDTGNVIGLYSPISKCGQTSLTLKMGEILSSYGRTIMLSFDSFSSLPKILNIESDGSITDLMYYSEGDRNKFCIYLEKIKKTVGNLDVVMPARTAMQIRDISADALKLLLELLVHEAGYKYVLLDLTEYPEGFFEILKLCDKLFTITRQTSADSYRVEIYEEVLRQNGYEDVFASMIKINLPDLKDPPAFSRYTYDLLKKEEIVSDKAG